MAGSSGIRDTVGDRGQREDTSGLGGKTVGGTQPRGGAQSGVNAEEAGDTIGLLDIVTNAEQENEQFLAALQRQSWQQTIRAYRNQHMVGSKYTSAPYRNRSKIFRPKVRTAIRKNMAAAASALFSTSDVLQIRAEYDTNPVKQASAAVLHQIVNYRLDRTATKSGVPWFLMAMGANLDAQQTGVCVSKQYWEREEVTETHEVEVVDTIEEPVIDEATGLPRFGLDGMPETTQRQSEPRTEVERNTYVCRDRPMVMLFPPEHVMIEPSAPWYDPAQMSTYLIAKHPMTVNDALAMLKNPGKNGIPWIQLTEQELQQCAEDFAAKSVRVERSGGVDRMDNAQTRQSGNIVWFYECFVRVEGVDYTFWTVGDRYFASQIRTTREAYPEQFGSRPYVYGYGQIESHNIAPVSMAESLMPFQIEANDLVNLRLDAAKQALSPIAVVRQGVVFDWKQLQHRGAADTTVTVKNIDDIRFEKTPSPDSSAYQEMNLLNVDMDELSGSFAGSSIQANRQLNETVGGMRLLSGSANSVTEFDLRVWVETWTEPALRQVVRCIQYYETDESVFAIAGARAKMMERFGVDAITDRDLESEVSVRIDVGIGTADPLQKLQKFAMAMSTIGNIAPFFDRKPVVKAEEVIKEVMGDAGYNDGMRFFAFPEEGDSQGADPELMKEQIKQQIAQMNNESAERIAQGKNLTMLENTDRGGKWGVIQQLISEIANEERAAAELQARRQAEGVAGLSDLFKTRMAAGEKSFSEQRAAEGARSQDASRERMARDANQSRERMAREGNQSRERTSRETTASRERTASEATQSRERTAERTAAARKKGPAK